MIVLILKPARRYTTILHTAIQKEKRRSSTFTQNKKHGGAPRAGTHARKRERGTARAMERDKKRERERDRDKEREKEKRK